MGTCDTLGESDVEILLEVSCQFYTCPLKPGGSLDLKVAAQLDRQMASNAWLSIAIREGKNREVRKIMEHLGHQVSRLIRVSYGPFQLGDLPSGGVEPVKPRVLADQLGIAPGAPQQGGDAAPAAARQQKKPSRGPRNADHRRPPSRHKTGPARRR